MFPDQYASDGAADLSEQLLAYIGNFLREGDPNDDDLTEWSAWEDSEDGRLSLVFGGTMEEGEVALEDVSVSYDEILAEMDADDSISDEAKEILISEVLNGRWFSAQLDEYYGNESLWAE